MTARILITGVVAGIGMFIWSSIAHMALPLGEAGIQELPDEQTILRPLQASLGGSAGMYTFPGMGTGSSSQRMQEYERKLETNPHGMLIYHPPGGSAMTPGQLIIEFLVEVGQALIAVILLAQARITGFAGRFGFVALIGIIAAISTNVSYWNWYGFPAKYTLACITIQFVGFLVAGAVAAAMLKRVPQAARAAA